MLGLNRFILREAGQHPRQNQSTMIYHIDTTTSTNDDARHAEYHHGDVIWAEHQTAGRGQRGHTWTSPEGVNLTFSLVLEPRFLPVHEQFLLSEVIALSLVDTFRQFGITTRIKWTNDIYVDDRKLVGILIEHNYSGGELARTIAGIGINVNQKEFDPALPNPVSMLQATGREFDREEVLKTFLETCMKRYAQLEAGEAGVMQRDYHQVMYRLGEQHAFRQPQTGEIVQATILGVKPTGELCLRHHDGSEHEYLFREIEFII